MTKIVLAVLAALVLAACAQKSPEAPPSPAEETRRAVETGELIGFVASNGAHAWRAIPYAAPPEGELRWRAPRPALAWEGTRDALQSGERCPQLSNAFHEGEGIEPGVVIGDEDCLTLDIYAPAGAREDEALPVMVWIHGGGNTWGRSAPYDGSVLAARENVIIVAVQYRMGPLGWFAHPALRDSADAPEDASANFGTLDLIAALEWVQRNIAQFGGDPGRVTVFGESAGGRNTVSLVASPLAKGLFHGAIVQSGNFDSALMAEAEGKAGSSDNGGKAVAARAGASDAAALRALSLEAVYGALTLDGPGSYDFPNVISDGVVLPKGPMRDAFASTETFNAIPVITGTNKDEMKLFQIFDPRLVKRVLGIFIVPRDEDFYDAFSEYSSRIWRIRAVDMPAAAMTAAGHQDVYAYRFDWDEGGRFLFMDTAKLLGAAHAMEIPFVFARFELFGRLDPVLFKKKSEASREALAQRMGAYWAAFVRDGAPVAEGLPRWPRWSEEGGSLMRFDSAAGGGPEAIAGADSIEALIADFRADPRLTEDERCAIALGLGGWFEQPGRDIAAALGCEGAA